MKKGILSTIIVVAVLALVALWMVQGYNRMVTEQENVEQAWGQVETQYQRRMDLIPNLVSTAKGLADKEQAILTGVIEARAKATQVTIDPTNITPNQLQAFEQAQSAVGSALSRLLVTIEKYPELKMDQGFLNLQAQLEGTENRIAVARHTFNECAQTYNTLIRKFPNNIVASMFGFERKPYFQAQEGADTAPKVEF